jgi:ATP-dependent Clp protease ATP-binding subunit ClpB
MQLEIEKQALHKETDRNSQDRLRVIEDELEKLRSESAGLRQKWHQEKELIDKVKSLKQEHERLRNEEEEATRMGDLQKAAEIRYGKKVQLEREIEAASAKIEEQQSESSLLRGEVDEEDIAKIVAKWTGIPVSRMLEGEIEKLVHMEQRLRKRVVGQEEALALVSNAIRRNRAGLSDPKRPIGTFVFLGPTGVGKTELGRALAEFLFDDERSMVRIDMSEYMEKHAVSRMIGAPPGYVGYDQGGQLTEHVRRKPYSVVLLDEIEKAHPDVFNVLLQVLDDGRLTDGKGRTVNFHNTVIIMTSNIGSTVIGQHGAIGFSLTHDAGASNRDMRDKLMEEMRRNFRPEFLNRIDDIIVFNRLGHEHLERILELQLGHLRKLLAEKKMMIELTPAAKELVLKDGYDEQFGARPLKRAIQRLIQDPLSLAILNGEFGEGDTVTVDRDGEQAAVRFEKKVLEPAAH